MRSSSQDHHQTSSGFLPTCPSLLAQYHEGVDHHKSSSFSSLLSLNSNFANDDDQEELPHSWSQILVDGLASEEGKFGLSHHFHTKKLENWEEQILLNPSLFRGIPNLGDHIKQENSQSIQLYGTHGDVDDDYELINRNQNNWSHQQVIMPLISSPRSSATSFGNNLFDFSGNKRDGRTQILNHSSECNSTSTVGVSKKARVRSSPPQPPLKVRTEKLGERITTLHQLVSPFGKTDTASVLLEAIGYIRFHQGQIEALSSPYLCNASKYMKHQQSGNQDGFKDLKSRGLCLVPISCTHHVSNDNGADYWAPSPGGGF